MQSRIVLGLVFALALRACPAKRTPGDTENPQNTFWTALSALCGKSFEGSLVEGTAPGDAEIGAKPLRMHVASCSETEIRIPFHVGDDHSRTWVLTRIPGGLRLKHDHRHADGTEDEITQYGGDTLWSGTPTLQDFHADDFTKKLLPASATNIWSLELVPGERFSYSLRREGRRFRVDFAL
jgi:hypothetical protein